LHPQHDFQHRQAIIYE
jgi:hypothetical protein